MQKSFDLFKVKTLVGVIYEMMKTSNWFECNIFTDLKKGG